MPHRTLCTAMLLATALPFTAFAGVQPHKRLVTFVFDQTIDAVIRIEDRNDDGDTLDPGEVARFIDDTIDPALGVENAQGLYALSRRHVLATDNFAPDNIVRLFDANDDGDAFDPGESTIFHDGALPFDYTLTNPASLTRDAAGDYYVIDTNTLDTTRPEAVYKLHDANNDGDVNDPEEVSVFWQFSPAGVSPTAVLEVQYGPGAALFAFDITSANTRIVRIAPDGPAATDYLTATILFNMTGVSLSGTLAEMTYDPTRERLILGGFVGNDIVIIALSDDNQSGTINTPAEVRLLWNEAASGFNTGSPRDLFWLPDDTILWVDALSDRIWRLVNLNGDNDYRDAGETTFIYEAAAAGAAGQINAPLMLSLSALYYCPADIDEDGAIGLVDLAILLTNFGTPSGSSPSAGDLNGDGAVDLVDLALLLTEFGLECDA